MVGWRYTESLPIAEAALALARRVGAREAEVRALTVLGGDLAYLGSAEQGVAHFRQALRLAEEIGDRIGLDRGVRQLHRRADDAGTARESGAGAVGARGAAPARDPTALLIANLIEALLALGDWDEAERLSAAALRGITSSFESWVLILRAEFETGRGEFDAARAHLEAARDTLREDRVLGLYDAHVADLALCERRWADADAAVQEGSRRHAGARRRRSVSSCAPRGCARRRNWRRSRAPVSTRGGCRPDQPRDGAARHGSPRRGGRHRGHARSRRLARACARPSTSAPVPPRDPISGPARRRPGSGSSARRWRPTAAGARPRRWSPRARRAPKRPRPSARRMPSPPVCARHRCSASSTCSPRGRGWT